VTIAFTRTREQLRDMVLRKLGKLAIGQTANNDDSVIVLEAIDLRLKEMHRLGTFWRKVTKTPLSFTLSANTTAGSAAADVLFPITLHAGSMDDPIEIIGIRQYSDIENKGDRGVPTKALHNGSSSFIFWPVPIANTTIKLVYEKVADDTAQNTQPDVEVSMLRWLKDIIAYDLADEFGISEQTILRWKPDVVQAERNIRNLNVERVDNAVTRFQNF